MNDVNRIKLKKREKYQMYLKRKEIFSLRQKHDIQLEAFQRIKIQIALPQLYVMIFKRERIRGEMV